MGTMERDAPAGREWSPDRRAEIVMMAGGLLLLAVGMVVHVVLWSWGRGWADVDLALMQMVAGFMALVVLGAAVIVLHELVHGAVIRLLGGRPTFGFGRTEEGGMAFFYTTAPGQVFTRTQFVVVALAPLVVLGALLAWWVWGGPYGGWLVLPAALHLSGCVGDLGLTWVVLRQPRGTLVEDRKAGVAFHDARPA